MVSATLQLSEEQASCVEFDGRALLIVAGPGSGKTATVTRAIVRLIESGDAHPSHIVAVTFTRLAAAEMRSRVASSCARSISGITIGTFHSICYDIVRGSWRELGYSNENIAVYDRNDAARLLKEILFISRNKVSQSAVVAAMEEIAQNGAAENLDRKVKGVIDLYMHALREQNAIDYANVAPMALRVIRDTPLRWRYMFVDEAQDLDMSHHKFIEAVPWKKLVAVGDPDQLIYGWRRASVDLMRSLPGRFSMEIRLLEQNYRSTEQVVRAANRLIRNNTKRIEKMIRGAGDESGEVAVVDEGHFAARYNHLRAAGGSIAVLGRTHAIVNNAWSIASREHPAGETPILVGRRDKLLERHDIKTVLSYLCWPELPSTPAMMERVLSCERVSDLTIQRIRAEAKVVGMTFFAAAMKAIPSLATWYAEFDGATILDRLMHCLRRHRLIGPGLDAQEKRELITIITAYIRQEAFAERSAARLVAWLNLRDGQDEVVRDEGTVPQFMTIHAAKGLEFDHVMVVGMDDRTLPHKRAHDTVDEMEEERRLLFVAITRAKKTATLVRPAPPAPPSRFFAEIDSGA